MRAPERGRILLVDDYPQLLEVLSDRHRLLQLRADARRHVRHPRLPRSRDPARGHGPRRERPHRVGRGRLPLPDRTNRLRGTHGPRDPDEHRERPSPSAARGQHRRLAGAGGHRRRLAGARSEAASRRCGPSGRRAGAAGRPPGLALDAADHQRDPDVRRAVPRIRPRPGIGRPVAGYAAGKFPARSCTYALRSPRADRHRLDSAVRAKETG